MDIDKATKEILSLAGINQKYISELQNINSELNVDDINDNTNKADVITALDIKNVTSKKDRAKMLAKKITDNAATINSLIAQVQLDPSYFDDSQMLAQYRAKNTYIGIPDAILSNSQTQVTFDFMNIGFKAWKASDNVQLQIKIEGGTEGYSNINYATLGSQDLIDIGDVKRFTTTIPTPSLPDTYTITATMYKGDVSFNFNVSRQINIA